MIHVLGSADQSTNREVVHHGATEFWAERGLIHSINTLNNSYESISVREMLVRLLAVSDHLKDLRRRNLVSTFVYQDDLRFIEKMITLCRKARLQGSPDDPTAVADLQRRQAKSFSLLGSNGRALEKPIEVNKPIPLSEYGEK